MIWENIKEKKPDEGKLLLLILKNGRIKKGRLLNAERDEWEQEGFKEMLNTDGMMIREWTYVD